MGQTALCIVLGVERQITAVVDVRVSEDDGFD